MIYCIKCNTPADINSFNTHSFTRCRSCGANTRIDVFPAMGNTSDTVIKQDELLIDDDASCFYHPKKKAAIHCSSCGRFICALCDVEIDGEHICFPCMETGKKKKKLTNLETHRTIYDGLVLRLAIFPVLFWPLTIISAPVVLFLIIKNWNSPSSIVRRSKIRFVAAFIIALAQVAGWIVGISLLLTKL